MNISAAHESLQPFVQIPKVELHAHLNGSLSRNTFEKLKSLKTEKTCNFGDFDDSFNFSSKDLSECFKLFSIIHNLTDNPEAVYLTTCDVINDFYDDGVRYLELRTTPREGVGMNQNSYVETVLKAIDTTMTKLNSKITVKLILSIDRKKPISSAEETLKIAEKYFTSSEAVVGIDLSGDPTVGNIKDFIPLLEYAKQIGLKLAVHTAEVPNRDYEIKELLKLQPHRLGHGTFLHPSKGGLPENFTTLKELMIPLEICLTSNVCCKTVPSYGEHHFQLFKDMNYPCVLCTDDKGVFGTSLSNEYFLASQYYSLTEKMLWDLAYESIDYIFSSKYEKKKLRNLWTIERFCHYSLTDLNDLQQFS